MSNDVNEPEVAAEVDRPELGTISIASHPSTCEGCGEPILEGDHIGRPKGLEDAIADAHWYHYGCGR